MKKWIGFFGIVFCFLLCGNSVQADVIWEPMNSFYEEHSSECTYVNRQYTANGPDGVVILYESPESAKVVTTWENGRRTYIAFTYEDAQGIVWGISDDEQTGWMPMDYMKVVYDSISFQEDYDDQIVSQDGSLDEQYRNDTVYFWKYPGSENCSSMNLQDWEYLPDYSSLFTDEVGHRWGYIGYYYGIRSKWVCLDAPTADYAALYPDGAPKIGKEDDAQSQEPENSGTDRIAPQTNDKSVMIVVALVALVVAATAVLLVILKKRDKGPIGS
ncbi:MAG: hypothetical protein K2K87_02615 [Lachnospiraceae bacterium]|nr:hypothetical protein [Lachnospiraceae bacterium]